MASLGNETDKNQTLNSSSDNAAQTTPSDSPPEASQSETQDKFTFLKELTTSSKHKNKSFYDHLFNVYTYLKEKTLPEEVCDAGLFHSIYGTETYHFQDDRVTRDVVRGYIGEYAEELVFIFCSIKKDRYKSIVLNTLGLSKQQHFDLCCVEFANSWDQKAGRERLERLAQTIVRLEAEIQEERMKASSSIVD